MYRAVMEAFHGGRWFTAHSAAVSLFLCSFALTSTCFSLRDLSKTSNPDEDAGEAAVLGSILFNGKALQFKSDSANAVENGVSDFYQLDGAETLQPASQLYPDTAEAAWMGLNASLHCDETKMTLKATGPAAAELQVNLGEAQPLPLIQLPETCECSIQQDALGLVLVVPFDGCGVTQKDEKYVLPMVWQETPVELTCPVLTSLDLTSDSTGPAPEQQPLDAGSVSSGRLRRNTNFLYSEYDPNSPLYPSYFNPMGVPNHPMSAPTTNLPLYPSPYPFPNYLYQNTLYPPLYPFYPQFSLNPIFNPLLIVPDYPDVYHNPIIQYFIGKDPNLPTTTEVPEYQLYHQSS